MQPRALQAGTDPAATLRAPPPPLPGRALASAQATPWPLIELLGSGSSSQVWRSTDTSGRSVALKIPASAGWPDDAWSETLRREHARLARLAHPHVVATFGLVERRGVPALALEYLPGGDLISLVGSHPRHWIEAACAVHAALTHLHARGFVHLDVKARNVLFGADGRARLIDFASLLPRAAHASRGGTTAAYRAALRANAPVDACDDTFAFAVLLYELLAGRLPYGVGGYAGAAAGGLAAWPLAAGVHVDAATSLLADRVLEVLRAHDTGLSAFADVLESAAAAYR